MTPALEVEAQLRGAIAGALMGGRGATALAAMIMVEWDRSDARADLLVGRVSVEATHLGELVDTLPIAVEGGDG